jgi:two-component system, OmpR family, response regulator
MMKRIATSCLVLCLMILVCTPWVAAEPAVPDFGKIVQIHLKYLDGRYSVSSQDINYGRAPNLNIKTGELRGVLLDSKGTELKSFSIRKPYLTQGDILTPPQDGGLLGYTESAPSADMTITAPYQQDMAKFNLINPQDNSVLVSADLTAAVNGFCTDYPNDPDCLSRVTLSPSATPDRGTLFVLATVFSLSVLIAAGLAIWTMRQRAKARIPEKETVLIVDDDPDIVDLIHLLLDKKGYATLKAAGGKECLEILKTHKPDLILLDVLMENIDGWQTLEQIKKNPQTKSIPTLMLTGKRFTAAEAKQYKLCIDDYIEKPFKPDELYQAVGDILERKHKVREALVMAKKAGIDQDKFCEFAKLTKRISVNKKIVDILQVPQPVPMLADLDALDNMSVIDYINVNNKKMETRAEQLREEFSLSFKSKGLPEFNW